VVRLAEHRELREALHLSRTPHFTTLQKSLERLGEEELERLLAETARSLVPPGGPPSTGACDATGLRTPRASSYFVRRLREMGQARARRGWLKHPLPVAVSRKDVTSQRARLRPSSDIPDLPPLVARGARVARLGAVLADTGCDSEEDHRYVREVIGAMSVIPARHWSSLPARGPGRIRTAPRLHLPVPAGPVRVHSREHFPERQELPKQSGTLCSPRK